jgi:hypothetical protein
MQLPKPQATRALSTVGEVPQADFALFDLASYQLLFFDEALAPWENPDRRPAPSVARWLEDMASADGYLFVVPEVQPGGPGRAGGMLDFAGVMLDPGAVRPDPPGSDRIRRGHASTWRHRRAAVNSA